MFEFTLICDEKEIFSGQVSKVLIETNTGPVEILPQHQPYMARIMNKIAYTIIEEGAQVITEIKDGFIYTNGSKCIAIVDYNINVS
jgi:F0F1-type ATP synthase epsilon subunit